MTVSAKLKFVIGLPVVVGLLSVLLPGGWGIAILFLACGVGLTHGARKILAEGQVTARLSWSIKDVILTRQDSPTRFYFIVVSFALLGIFSLAVSAISFIALTKQI